MRGGGGGGHGEGGKVKESGVGKYNEVLGSLS